MARDFSVRFTPNGETGYIVYWHEGARGPKMFKIVQNRKQLMKLLKELLDEVERGKD